MRSRGEGPPDPSVRIRGSQSLLIVQVSKHFASALGMLVCASPSLESQLVTLLSNLLKE